MPVPSLSRKLKSGVISCFAKWQSCSSGQLKRIKGTNPLERSGLRRRTLFKTKLVLSYHNGASSHSNRLGFRDLIMEPSKSLGIVSSCFCALQHNKNLSTEFSHWFTVMLASLSYQSASLFIICTNLFPVNLDVCDIVLEHGRDVDFRKLVFAENNE